MSFTGGEHVITSVSDGAIFINGSLIGQSAVLENGDLIRVGNHEMRFVRLQDLSATTLQLSICRRNEPHDVLLTRRPELRIGRSTGELRIDDAFIADPHCVIENPYPGLLYIKNLDEVRGTKLNGARVTERERIQDGDILSLGTTTIHLNVLDQSAMPQPGQSIAILRPAGERPLADPDHYGWDSAGITQELAGADDDTSSGEHRAMSDEEVSWRGSVKQPYYVPKTPGAKRADAGADLGFHEGITSELPGVNEGPKRPKAQYYLPDEED